MDDPDRELPDLADRARREAEAVQAFGALPGRRRYPLLRARFPYMSDLLATLEAPRVLDAGMGQAKLQRLHLHRHPNHAIRWHGADLSSYRLALRTDVQGIGRVQANVQGALPYPDGAFDAAVCSWVFQHLPDPTSAMNELARVVRPGGLVLVSVPHSPQPVKGVQDLFHPTWVRFRARFRRKKFSYSPQVQFYNLPRLRRMAQTADLEVVRWQGFGFPISGGPLRFLENYRWVWQANLRFGAALPRMTKQLLVVARKPERQLNG
ncbi:class I SAM-dependent methyltransferase [Planctomycetota bacterium]|nr:class I SAM-dependent methyltransferase [Planctomycetota bacterium]